MTWIELDILELIRLLVAGVVGFALFSHEIFRIRQIVREEVMRLKVQDMEA